MTAAFPALEKLMPNPEWASLPIFSRTGWTRMAFGEFAQNVNERAEPKDAQEDIYVGLAAIARQRAVWPFGWLRRLRLRAGYRGGSVWMGVEPSRL
jgi:hypothetical protein